MAIRKIDGYEVPGYESLTEAAQELFGLTLPADEAIRLLTQRLGTEHEHVPTLATHRLRQWAHQLCGSAIYDQLTMRYTDLSKSKALQLIEAANPEFDADQFKHGDERLDKGGQTLAGQQAKGQKMAETSKKKAALRRAKRHEDKFHAKDAAPILANLKEAEQLERDAFNHENGRRTAAGLELLTLEAWREKHGLTPLR